LTFIFQRTADEFDDRGLGAAGRKEDEIMARKLKFALHAKAKHSCEPSLARLGIFDAQPQVMNDACRKGRLIRHAFRVVVVPDHALLAFGVGSSMAFHAVASLWE
jgi:hypothetical protein